MSVSNYCTLKKDPMHPVSWALRDMAEIAHLQSVVLLFINTTKICCEKLMLKWQVIG